MKSSEPVPNGVFSGSAPRAVLLLAPDAVINFERVPVRLFDPEVSTLGCVMPSHHINITALGGQAVDRITMHLGKRPFQSRGLEPLTFPSRFGMGFQGLGGYKPAFPKYQGGSICRPRC